jgi:arginine-tRNA-protein transferase
MNRNNRAGHVVWFMMFILSHMLTDPHPCAYLPNQACTMEYALVAGLLPSEYESLMNKGFRKFGNLLFRNACKACSECRPIRIDVARFRPDRCQRRVIRRSEDLELEYGDPLVDEEHLDLYRRYHSFRSQTRDWPEQNRTVDEYASNFLDSQIPAIEIRVRDAGALRAVVLTDVTPNVLSGVYHYYDPEHVERSLGTFCMLQTIALAARMKKPWAYFGYYVAGCGSMAYKARFRPCEVMTAGGKWSEIG